MQATPDSDLYIKFLYEVAFKNLSKHIPPDSTRIIELGAGTGTSRKFLPNTILTDISHHPSLDITCKSENLPFRSESLDALILKDTFHHIPDIETFLLEATRVLRENGKIVVFDPYWGFLARIIYRFLHQERFDMRAHGWKFESSSPWDSNQALSYILLRRDRSLFNERFPNLRLEEHGALIGPSFLLSGGVSRRTIISGRFLAKLLKLELRQSQWFRHLSFFHIFSLTKQNPKART